VALVGGVAEFIRRAFSGNDCFLFCNLGVPSLLFPGVFPLVHGWWWSAPGGLAGDVGVVLAVCNVFMARPCSMVSSDVPTSSPA
jgi:hypothetical protein